MIGAVRSGISAAILLIAIAALATSGRAAVTPVDDAWYVQVSRERVVGQTAIPVNNFKVVQTYPHDTGSYTEGLVMRDGFIYEGTGRYGLSQLRQYELQTGRVIHDQPLDKSYFGEGVTVLDGTIYQLTYLANTGFTYDRATFVRKGTFRYLTQGWGLTTDGTRLFMSNGSSSIVFLDPRTLAMKGRIFVSDNAGPVGFLNELEYVKGKLYANVWQTDFIAIIAPENGRITGWIDLGGLNPSPETLKYPYVLNGIAFNEATGHLLVTGKCWPAIYEIELIPRLR
jgi:glutaminyl-peptide cyclotransferase